MSTQNEQAPTYSTVRPVLRDDDREWYLVVPMIAAANGILHADGATSTAALGLFPADALGGAPDGHYIVVSRGDLFHKAKHVSDDAPNVQQVSMVPVGTPINQSEEGHMHTEETVPLAEYKRLHDAPNQEQTARCPTCGSPGIAGSLCGYWPDRPDGLGPQPEGHTTTARREAPPTVTPESFKVALLTFLDQWERGGNDEGDGCAVGAG